MDMLNKTAIESINTYSSSLAEKRRSLVGVIDQIVKVQGHCDCPLCERPFTEQERKAINELHDLAFAALRELDTEIERKRIADAPRLEVERRKREADQTEFKEIVGRFIEAHEKVFAKIVRAWRKDGTVTLPVLETPIEQKIWDSAIEKWAGSTSSRDDVSDNIDDFQFGTG